MDIYISNLNYQIEEDELRSLFSQFGTVEKVVIKTDKVTGQSRGFGFVTMANNIEAENAISTLDGEEISGRKIVVQRSKQ